MIWANSACAGEPFHPVTSFVSVMIEDSCILFVNLRFC
jgi:hypothetical protein